MIRSNWSRSVEGLSHFSRWSGRRRWVLVPLLGVVVASVIVWGSAATRTSPLVAPKTRPVAPSTTPTTATAGAPKGACGLSTPAFCDTFDQRAGTGNRSGELNGTLWGVSRVSGGRFNAGQGQADSWIGPTTLAGSCPTQTVQADGDIKVCDGQLNEVIDDNPAINASNQNLINEGGDVTSLAMYPKQPFDFAGRTGKVVFDVSDDSGGVHMAWPEVWITDKPGPDPFAHFSSWQSLPQNGFGLRLGAACAAAGAGPGSGGGNCAPNCPKNNTSAYVTVASAIVVNSYVGNDGDNSGTVKTVRDSCVREPNQPGQLNHFELDVSQNQIDIFGTDAGTVAPLKHLGTIPNANLGFTRGLVWLEDVHYNGNKGIGLPNVFQAMHTFTWDNVGFDGPVLARDLAFDAPDALAPVPGYPTMENLGWYGGVARTVTVSIPGVSGISQATGGLLTFNTYNGSAPVNYTYSLNGNPPHTYQWPFKDTAIGSPRQLVVPIALSDVVTGTNTVTISADDTRGLFIANLDMVMVGAGGTH